MSVMQSGSAFWPQSVAIRHSSVAYAFGVGGMRGSGGERQRILNGPTERSVALASLDLQPRVGRSLARLRHELLDASAVLRGILEPDGKGLLSDAVRLLDRQVCRVAVIGQIKAGK